MVAPHPPPSPPGDLVRILWEDIRDVDGGWSDLADVDRSPTLCLSVGWLIHEDARSVVIVGSVSDDRGVGGGLVIPPSAIVEWVTIDQ